MFQKLKNILSHLADIANGKKETVEFIHVHKIDDVEGLSIKLKELDEKRTNGSEPSLNIVVCTKAEYDNLSERDENTYYFITN